MKAKKTTSRIFLLSVFLVLTSACAKNIFFVRTLDKYFEPLAENASVKVFIAEKPDKESYDEIGMIAVRGGDIEQRYHLARAKAREVGGDALLHLDEKNQQASFEKMNNTYGHFTDTKGKTTTFFTTTPTTETYSYVEERFLVVRLKK